MKKVIFIGGIGNPKQFGGELTKNKLLTKRLRDFFAKLTIIDTYQSRSKPWKLWRLPFILLMHPKTPIVFSTSYGNVYWLHRILKALSPGRKIVLWVIGGDLHTEVKRGRYRVDVLQTLQYLLVEGQAMQEELCRQGIVNVEVIPNFKDISLAPASGLHTSYNQQNGKLRLVFFSRIMPEKGCDLILNLANRLNEEGYQDKFIIDFWGPIAPDYRERFSTLLSSLTNVEYKGSLDLFSELGYATLASYHLSLFPTYWSGEGFPGVIIDSFMAGLPILASDWGLNKELVGKETGFIIPTHDTEAMASIVSDIIDGIIDLEPLSQEAYRRAFRYDVNHVVTKDLIEKIFK